MLPGENEALKCLEAELALVFLDLLPDTHSVARTDVELFAMSHIDR